MIGPYQYESYSFSKKRRETLQMLRNFWSVDSLITRRDVIMKFCQDFDIDVPEQPVTYLDLSSGFPPFKTFWAAVASILKQMKM